jgi:hypothetical protein
VNKARKGSENHSTQVSLSWSSINFFTEAVVLLAKNKMKDKFSKPSWTVSDSSFMKVPSIYKKNLLSLTTTRENSLSQRNHLRLFVNTRSPKAWPWHQWHQGPQVQLARCRQFLSLLSKLRGAF